MAKYIKCECCGAKIHFGESVYRFNGHAPLFCSAECYADAYGVEEYLDDELAITCWRKVYDDEEEKAIRAEIEKTKADIASLEAKLKGLEFDLKGYESL